MFSYLLEMETIKVHSWYAERWKQPKVSTSWSVVSVVSHDRRGRYGQTVFNEMIAYMNMPLTVLLFFCCRNQHASDVKLYIFPTCWIGSDVQWFYIKCTSYAYLLIKCFRLFERNPHAGFFRASVIAAALNYMELLTMTENVFSNKRDFH